jgi:hypothetical protein
MAENRLSKLQKWILINCYNVTVLHDRSGLEKLNGLTYGFLNSNKELSKK